MEFIVANVDNIKFDIEIALEEQYGALPLPFAGMDKSIAAVCEFYPKGSCQKGVSCPFRHVRGDRTIVCKHWLRGLCKKGDQCEFLHEYDMSKMPECYFYSRFNACHNKECPFLHIDPESKIKDCPWYDRGFCRHGPNCRHRHVRRVLCMNYLAGFCPEGPDCKFMHPRFELPATDVQQKDGKKLVITCHYCGESGHKALYCNKLPPEMKEVQSKQEDYRKDTFSKFLEPPPEETPPSTPGRTSHCSVDNGGKSASETCSSKLQTKNLMYVPKEGPPVEENAPKPLQQKPLEEVTCFKCGCKGHYANKCPKGHLAFLSQSQNPSLQANFRRN